MADLFNTETLKAEKVPEDQILPALQSGQYAFKKGVRIPMIKPDGEAVTVDAAEAQNALQAGYTVEAPHDEAARKWAEEKGTLGAAATFAGQAVNQTLFGVPGAVADHLADPMDRAKWEALQKRNQAANLLGGAVGVGGSLFIGGPVFKAGEAAGNAAARTVGRMIGAETAGQIGTRTASKAVKEIVGRLTQGAVKTGVEGAVQMAPLAITEEMLGDHDAAAEALLAGGLIGGLLGGGGALVKDVTKLGAKAVLDAAPESVGQFFKEAGKKSAKVLTGVDERAIERYIQRQEKVLQAKPLDELTPGFLETLEKVATDEISPGSSKGYKILENSPIRMKVEEITGPLLENMAKVAERAEYSSETQAVVEKILNMGKRLEDNAARNGGEITVLEARRFMDALRDEGYQAKRMGLGKMGQLGDAIRATDGTINGTLRHVVDGYAEHMDEVSGMVKTFKDLNDRFRSPGGAQNLLKRVMNGKDKFAEEALQKFDAEFKTTFVDDLKDSWAAGQFRKDTTNGSRKTLLGTAIGGALGGAAGGMAGSVIGAAADKFGTTWVQKAVDGILIAEKSMKQAAKNLDEIPEILEGLKKFQPTASPSALATRAALSLVGHEHEKTPPPAEVHKIIGDGLTRWSANPQGLSTKIAELTHPIGAHGAPTVSGILNQKMTKAYTYAAAALPRSMRNVNPFAHRPAYQPPAHEMNAFIQKMQILKDPFAVLGHLKAGTLTIHHMDALKNVYPRIHSLMVDRVQRSVLNGVKPIPYQSRVNLSLLMGQPLDASMQPDAINRYQAEFAQGDEQDQENAAQGDIPDFSNDAMTDVQRMNT